MMHGTMDLKLSNSVIKTDVLMMYKGNVTVSSEIRKRKLKVKQATYRILEC
jgi:hypothetical protein